MRSKKFEEKDIKLTLENNFLGIVNVALQNLDSFYKTFTNEVEKNQLDSIINPIIDSAENLTLDKLIEAQQSMYALYPQYKNKTFSAELNFDDQKEVLLALLNVAILTYFKDDLGGDIKNISLFSMNFSDFKSLFSAIYSDERAEYDKEGRKITGIFQGLK